MTANALRISGCSCRLSTFVRLMVVFFVLAGPVYLGGCSHYPLNDAATTKEMQSTNDPFEPFNRGIFAFNEVIDAIALKPIASTYRFITPQFLRDRIHSALKNLNEPVVFANSILQGEVKQSSLVLTRFLINSTFGLLGTFDVAAKVGLEPQDEDFGQTLAKWGVGEGPYLVLPLLGPSNPRDALGRVGDHLMDPFEWAAARSDDDNSKNYGYARTGLRIIDKRERMLDQLEEIKRSSVDYYAAIRSMYRQNRRNIVEESKENKVAQNKKTKEQNEDHELYDFDYSFDDESFDESDEETVKTSLEKQ